MAVVFSHERAALLDRLRAEARACQNGLAEFPFSYAVDVADALRKCPADASLEMQWACRCGAILDAMSFLSDCGETMVGRLCLPSGTPEEVEAAWTWLTTESPMKGYRPVGQSGHCEPCYRDVFEIGLDGLLAKARRLAGSSPSGESRECLRSFVHVLEAFSRMIERAADQAADPEVAQRCRAIAHRPPVQPHPL